MLTRLSNTAFQVSDNRRLTFYPAVFNQETSIVTKTGTVREVIRPGAFTRTLEDPSKEVVATVNHDSKKELAKRSTGDLLLQEDNHGLFASFWLPDTELGDEVLRGVLKGTITGASFGFDPVEMRTQKDGLIEQVQCGLFDVCVAVGAAPAYAGTEVHLRTQTYLASLLARARYLNFKFKHTY